MLSVFVDAELNSGGQPPVVYLLLAVVPGKVGGFLLLLESNKYFEKREDISHYLMAVAGPDIF